MPQKTPLIWSCTLHAWTTSNLLQWCKKLLQSDSFNCGSSMSMLTRSPKTSSTSMVLTIHGMQHHVQSTYRDLVQSQGHKQWTQPLVGIGQGNGSGPHIWAAVSTPLFQILMKEGFIAQVICSMSQHHRTLAGFGFVNDIDLCINNPSNNGVKVVQRMQESINLWVGLLHATGGTLVPEKCFWYYIHNWWENGCWQYVTVTNTQRLSMPDDTGNTINIPQLAPLEAHQTLGVWLAPDGNNEDEFNYLLEVSKSWCCRTPLLCPDFLTRIQSLVLVW